MKKIIEEIAVKIDSATQGLPCDDENKFIGQNMPHVSVFDLLNDVSVVPSNNGGRIHRLGYLEIIEDDTEKVEVDTEGMTPEELEDLRTWEIEKAADEGRLRFREFVITEEEAQRLGISFCYTGERVALRHGIQIPCNHRFGPIAINESLRPASRPNKKNNGKTYYTNF